MGDNLLVSKGLDIPEGERGAGTIKEEDPSRPSMGLMSDSRVGESSGITIKDIVVRVSNEHQVTMD
jgi:hypothetical protein